MTIRVARPLPECQGPACGLPVRRDVYLENGGLCSSCRLEADWRAPVQLELDDVEPRPQQEAACRWAHGECAVLDSRGLCSVCAADGPEAGA